MTTANVKALVAYRLEQADESLEAAHILLDQGLNRPSVNRSYYAIFYAVLGLLAIRKQETSKHSGAISLFEFALYGHGHQRSPHLHISSSQLRIICAIILKKSRGCHDPKKQPRRFPFHGDT